MKSVVIIGGGIAGLNAGIELLQHGFDVSLYEKNSEVGGLCSGYFVDGYNIDTCLHWLMGTKINTKINNLWRNIDAINDDVKISSLPNFCSFIYKGTKVTFARNLDEEEIRWLELSPEDEKEIKIFFSCVRDLAKFWLRTQSDKRRRFNKSDLEILPDTPSILSALKSTRVVYSKRFKHPALRFAIENAMTGYSNIGFFMLVYGLFSVGDGDVPFGGSYMMVKRIKEKYLSLGGKLFLNCNVSEIKVIKRKVKHIVVNEKKIKGDYFISAIDPNFTLKYLLRGKYKVLTYSLLNTNIKRCSISSAFCVYLKVKDFKNDIDTPTAIKIDEIRVGKHLVDSLLVRPYAFDETYHYDNAAVVSLFIDQNENDFDYFAKLTNYDEEYKRIVNNLVDAFKKGFPQYKDKVEVLTSFGPMELYKRTNSSFGAIQSYSFTNSRIFYSFKGKIRNISNLYLASQWNRSIGGTPTALISSHNIVNTLLKDDKRGELLKTLIKRKSE